MSVSDLYVLHSIVVASPALALTQLEDGSAMPESQLLNGYSASGIDPQFRSVASQDPKFSGNTTQLESLLDLVGVYGRAIPAAGGGTTTVDLQFRTRQNLGVPQTTGPRLRAYAGLLRWDSLTLPSIDGNQAGSAQIEFSAIWDGTNAPLAGATATALGTNDADEFFGAGPVTINGADLGCVQGIEVRLGQQVERRRCQSEVWPSHLSISGTDPVVTIRNLKPGLLATYNLIGTELTELVFYARRKKKHSANYADGDAEHIKFTATAGWIEWANARGSARGAAEGELRIHLTRPDASTDFLTIETGQAIA